MTFYSFPPEVGIRGRQAMLEALEEISSRTRNACYDGLRKQKRQLKRVEDYRYFATTDKEWVADELLTAQLLEVIRAQIIH